MKPLPKYHIRPLTPDDQAFLWEMLYQSLYVPAGGDPLPRQIVRQPEIARYVENWGRVHDCGFIAEDESGKPLGAAWMRLFKGEEHGYGYINDATPEVGMAVLPEYRGQGIGTELLMRLLAAAEGQYAYVSLSVGSGNPAAHLYERLGFEVVKAMGDSVIMRKKMNPDSAHKSRWEIAEVVFGIPFLISLGVHAVAPLSVPPGGWRLGIIISGVVLIIAAIGVVRLARRELRKYNQPTDPGQPTSRLVNTGVFRYSRNPLYLASVMLFLGLGLALNRLWAVAALVLSIVICIQVLIRPEERYLAAKFGEDYQQYAASVHRWLGRR